MQHEANMIAFGDSPINGGLPYGAIHDVYMDCDLPMSQEPKAEHSMKMAGKDLGLACGGLGDMI